MLNREETLASAHVADEIEVTHILDKYLARGCTVLLVDSELTKFIFEDVRGRQSLVLKSLVELLK